MWISTARFPELCHRHLRSVFQSTNITKRLSQAGFCGRKPKFQSSSGSQFLTVLSLSFPPYTSSGQVLTLHRFVLTCGSPSLLLNDDKFAALATSTVIPSF